jgi:hypothetical protein
MHTTIDYSWQHNAVCKNSSKDMGNYDVFYPQIGRGLQKKIYLMCEECPVKPECLNHALQYEEYGYWAGTSSKERKKIRKELGIKLVSIDFLSMLKSIEDKDKQDIAIQSQKMKRGPKGPRKKNTENTLTQPISNDYHGDNLEDDWSF